jgi:2-amino-4-hydroxy-6-hydroxymethyldihydropteridine diphosphokinase
MAKTSYAIALGSNRRSRHGSPRQTIVAAAAEIGVKRLSPIIQTPAVGPAGRSFANAAALLETHLAPAELLILLKAVERAFGRRGGRRWGARVLDLDIILWSGGSFADANLIVPHPAFRQRDFVLRPLVAIAPHWRDPLTGLHTRQLLQRFHRPSPVDRRARHT